MLRNTILHYLLLCLPLTLVMLYNFFLFPNYHSISAVHGNTEGLDNLRASEPCEADVQGTQVSLKNNPVSLNSTQVSLSSSPVSLMVSIYVGGCSCLASLACLACMACTFGSHASHVWLAWLARLASWLAHWPHSKTDYNVTTVPCSFTITVQYCSFLSYDN